jgi:hypothetical protein
MQTLDDLSTIGQLAARKIQRRSGPRFLAGDFVDFAFRRLTESITIAGCRRRARLNVVEEQYQKERGRQFARASTHSSI